jgi:poly-gamma-glutamate capsule biosynthesis protein CapA/YwtB (metallophosphatase superfamily)
MLSGSTTDRKQPVRLAIVGDCMLGRGVDQTLQRHRPEYPWGDTLSLFQIADLRLCNLECVLSDRGAPWSEYPKAFHFRSAAKNVAVLTAAGINAVSIANNHVLDYGYEAMTEMLQILEGANIAYAGAGVNLAQASRIATFETQSRRFGLIAFTDNEPPWEAKDDRPGAFYVPVDLNDCRAQYLLEIIRGRKQVDTLIVSAHWGGNWGYTPLEEQVQFAHALIDAGADIIFGHSSHVFRGIECYRNGLILYGAGNFVDDYAVDPVERNDESFLFLVEFEGSGLRRLRLYPTTIDFCQAHRARAPKTRDIAQKMQDLCSALATVARWDPEEQLLEIDIRTFAPLCSEEITHRQGRD